VRRKRRGGSIGRRQKCVEMLIRGKSGCEKKKRNQRGGPNIAGKGKKKEGPH